MMIDDIMDETVDSLSDLGIDAEDTVSTRTI